MKESFLSRAGRLWCTLMHEAPMWPIGGRYRCSICLRTYPISWAHKEPVPTTIRRVPAAGTPAVSQIGGFAVAPVAFAGDRRQTP